MSDVRGTIARRPSAGSPTAENGAMTNRERILALIQSSPEGLTDAEIREHTGIQPHQQVNQICRVLEQIGHTKRVDGPMGRIINVSSNFSTLEFGNEIDDGEENGLEIEVDDSSEIRRPFNPEKIKVRTVNIVVDQLVSRIEHGEIDLAPDFQRMAGIWDDERKSRLVESLLLRIPIPVFYVAADGNEIWSVVDGLQRTSTIHSYATGRFPLVRLEYLAKLNGYRYEDLPRPMQRRISETQLVVNVIEPGTPEEVMFNIFSRINTGGMTLNGQEIRHALHPGPARDYLKELAETEEFLNATAHSLRTRRMEDRECVLRFLAFHIDPWEKYAANDLNGYLGTTMKKINKMVPSERNELLDDFKKAMRAASDIFGEDAFRKRYHMQKTRRRPINKALLEAWGVGLARRSPEEIEILVDNKEAVIGQFLSLMNDDKEFETAISSSTGAPGRVRKRFGAIDQLIAGRL